MPGKQRTAGTFAILSLSLLGMGLFLVGGCSQTPPYTSHGGLVVEVDKDLESRVSLMVYSKMANWVYSEDGTKSDPTYKAGERAVFNGTDTTDRKKAKYANYLASVGTFEWQGADGHYCIRTVHIRGRQTLVMLESDNDKARMLLFNTFIQTLNEMK